MKIYNIDIKEETFENIINTNGSWNKFGIIENSNPTIFSNDKFWIQFIIDQNYFKKYKFPDACISIPDFLKECKKYIDNKNPSKKIKFNKNNYRKILKTINDLNK